MRLLGILLFFLWISPVAAQDKVHWLTFEALEDSLQVKPKKVYIDFYADWCKYCKKMDQAAYRDKSVIKYLNDNFYAVKMHAESKDTITFDDVAYTNNQLQIKRNPIHQIPLLLASREGVEFSLPAIIILDKNFKVQARYFEYLSPKRLESILASFIKK